MLKYILENIEMMCIRPREKDEIKKMKEKKDLNDKLLEKMESIKEYECSNCFIFTTAETEYKKAKINKALFGFCSENCYKQWLKFPRVFTKINENDLIIMKDDDIDGL